MMNRQIFHIGRDVNGQRNLRRDIRTPLAHHWLPSLPPRPGHPGRTLGIYVPGQRWLYGLLWNRSDAIYLDAPFCDRFWKLLLVYAHELVHRFIVRGEGLVRGDLIHNNKRYIKDYLDHGEPFKGWVRRIYRRFDPVLARRHLPSTCPGDIRRPGNQMAFPLLVLSAEDDELRALPMNEAYDV